MNITYTQNGDYLIPNIVLGVLHLLNLTSKLGRAIIRLTSKLGNKYGGASMNKEEILAKSRKEKNDEGLIAAENKGRKIGITVFICIFAFITLFDFFNGQSNYAANGLFWAFLATEAYPKYKFTSKSGYLIMVIAGVLICIVSLASYVLTVLR